MTNYQSKVKTVEEAVRLLRDGDNVMIGHAICEPAVFMKTLAQLKDEFKDITIAHEVYVGAGETLAPEMEGHIRHNVIFAGKPSMAAVAEGRADFTPTTFHELPALITEDYLPVDVFVAQCTKPDANGYVNLGLSCDYALASIQKARLVIMEVNEQMPTTFGETFIHIDEVDCFYEANHDLIQLMPPSIGEIEKLIGGHVASLIPDGACLQLGIGALPDAILSFLGDKKDLGIHTEMISDGVVPLIKSGVINCKRKQTYPGKIVSTFLMGTRAFYDFVDKNPMLVMVPVNESNAPEEIAKNDNVIAVNSCVEVDLMGQVCSEAIGEKQISGIGGQLDFCRGANKSKGGKAILCTPSRTKKGQPKIVPYLQAGAPVTTDRCDVNYIVTEYGIAPLKGKSLRQRAINLINVAHPDDRAALIVEFERRFKTKFN